MANKWRRARTNKALTDISEPGHAAQITQLQWRLANDSGKIEAHKHVEWWRTDDLKARCIEMFKALTPKEYEKQSRVYLTELRKRGIRWTPES